MVLGEPATGKPAATYRMAGDSYILVEYGEMAFDLLLNFHVQAVDQHLRGQQLPGVVETSPAFRSILVSYEPNDANAEEVIDFLEAAHHAVAPMDESIINARVITLPVAFDDSATRDAIARYTRSVRADAPNTEGGTNVDYVVRYNGLRDREELFETFVGSDWWTAFVGFFPGLPFMFPLDSRDALFAPKYNPTRTWTPEGAIGLGGPCVTIYPVESPGGYQLLGRTLPIQDFNGGNAAFRDEPLLVKPADRLRFYQVSEPELREMEAAVREDRYRYDVESAEFSVGEHMRRTVERSPEAQAHLERRDAAAALTPLP
jgi:urea carboxylase